MDLKHAKLLLTLESLSLPFETLCLRTGNNWFLLAIPVQFKHPLLTQAVLTLTCSHHPGPANQIAL